MKRNNKKLIVGAFQFPAGHDIAKNLSAIERGIKSAAKKKVRLLLTQECALCGYPPVETPSTKFVDWKMLQKAFVRVSELAKKNKMYIALGTLTHQKSCVYNSVCLINPDGKKKEPYHKRALWGWDLQNFCRGKNGNTVYVIDGIKIGIRICYEVRFPEYFRELFNKKVELALVSFSDVGDSNHIDKFDIIESHLVSRAAENAMYVLSANSISKNQLAPTCLIDPDGKIIASAPLNKESLLTGKIEITSPNFGRQGRIIQSKMLNII